MRQTQRTESHSAGRRPGWLISTAAIALISGGALALEPGEGGNDVLKGPSVKNTGAPDRGGSDRAPEDRVQRAQRSEEPRLAAYMMAVRSLQRADDESLRLTQDQQEQLRAIATERREQMAAFMEAHKDEIYELRKQAGIPGREQQGDGREKEPRQRGDRPVVDNEMDHPPSDDAQRGPSDNSTQGNRPNRQRRDRQAMDREDATPEQKAAREQLRALMETAPSEKDAIQKAMGVLTVEQQSHVKKAIAQGRERMRNRRESGERGRDAQQGMEERRDGAARRGRARGREGGEAGEQRTRRAKPSDG